MSLVLRGFALLGSLLGAASSAAHTPAPWVADYSRCVGERGVLELSGLRGRLTNTEARRLALKIGWACEQTMPADMPAGARAKFINSTRSWQARSLRHHSSAGTYAKD
jgi:hypothetical protein